MSGRQQIDDLTVALRRPAMTYRDEPPVEPASPVCPRCKSDEHVTTGELPPKHDPTATSYCERCEMPFSGTKSEAFRLSVEAIGRATAKAEAEAARQAGIDRGVIGGPTSGDPT